MRGHWIGLLPASLSYKMYWVWSLKIVKHFSQYNLPKKSRTLYCRLTSSLLDYIYAAIFFPVLICPNAGIWIFPWIYFCNEKDFTSKYTEKSGIIFWFCNLCVICFCKKSKNLKNYKISNTQKYCGVRKRGLE